MATVNINTVLQSLNFFAIITPYAGAFHRRFKILVTDLSSIYSFSLFLPSIISSLGYDSVKAQLFTVPPNMAGFFAVILCTYISDKITARGPVMIGCCSLAIVGYIMLLVKARPLVHYAGYVIDIDRSVPVLILLPALSSWQLVSNPPSLELLATRLVS